MIPQPIAASSSDVIPGQNTAQKHPRQRAAKNATENIQPTANALVGDLQQREVSGFVGSLQGMGQRAAPPPLCNLIAGRVGVISAYDVVVIARSYHSCTNGCGTYAYAYAAARISSAIGAATITRMDASDVNTSRTCSASIR